MGAIAAIDADGRIVLGQEHAGKTVIVDEIEPGVWIVKIGRFIPDSERWLHRPEDAAKLAEAIAWAEANPPADNFDAVEARISPTSQAPRTPGLHPGVITRVKEGR